jgi:archaellum biogenesis ATPase FlaH
MSFREIDIAKIKQRERLLPNEDVMIEAQREEVQLLSIVMRKGGDQYLQDMMDCTEVGVEHFLFAPNARMFSLVCKCYMKNRSRPTRIYIEKQAEYFDSPAQVRSFYEKIVRLNVEEDNYEQLKRGLVARFLQQSFFEITMGKTPDEVGLMQRIFDAKDDQDKLIDKMRDQLLGLEAPNDSEDKFTKTVLVKEEIDEVYDEIMDRRMNPEAHQGMMCGIPGFDNTLNGWKPGEYSILVGHPNGGKTTTMINLAVGMAERGARVCYVTVESSSQQLIERLISRESKIDSAIIKKGGQGEDEINQERANKIYHAKEKIKEMLGDTLCFITVPQKTKITSMLARVEKQRRFSDFDVLFVDYLDVIDSVERYPDRKDLEIGDVSVRLQSYGRRHGLTTFTAQSFNNEMIKAIKKCQENASDDEESDLENVVGIEGVGGTQKLSRDADYMWGIILGNQGLKLSIFWLKSRNTGKERPFILNAFLDCCLLVQRESFQADGNGTGPILPNVSEEEVAKGIEAISSDEDGPEEINKGKDGSIADEVSTGSGFAMNPEV